MDEFRIELAFDVMLGKQFTFALTNPEKIAAIKKYLDEGLDVKVFFPDYEPTD